MTAISTNFAHLREHDEQLLRLGMLAEKYFPDDPNTSLLKLRQLAELLAQLVAAKIGIYTSAEEQQFELLRRIQEQGILPRETAQLFHEVRRLGNAASHAMRGELVPQGTDDEPAGALLDRIRASRGSLPHESRALKSKPRGALL